MLRVIAFKIIMGIGDLIMGMMFSCYNMIYKLSQGHKVNSTTFLPAYCQIISHMLCQAFRLNKYFQCIVR